MKYLTTLLFIFTISSIDAQMTKGTILTGGSLSFFNTISDSESSNQSFSEEYDVKQTLFSISPSLGIFTSESVVIGLGLGYEYLSINRMRVRDGVDSDDNSTKHSNYTIAPFVRKYSSLTDNLYFTTNMSLSIAFRKVINESENQSAQEVHSRSLGARVAPGLTYFASDKWAISAGIGSLYFDRTETELDNSENPDTVSKGVTNEFGLSARANTFSVGFQYFMRNGAEE